MNRIVILMVMIVFYFGLGFASGLFFHDIALPLPEVPSTSVFIPSEKPSPANHISEDQIKIYDHKVEILLDGRQVSWARFAGSNSMDPVLDESANSIEVVPRSVDDIHVGDIVAFAYGNSLIVHRVLETGYDGAGWYALTGGDNARTMDAGKRRFEDIKFITVGILY